MTDLQVRQALRVPSVDEKIRVARINVLAQVVGSPATNLQAQLSSDFCPRSGASPMRMPWMTAVLKDLQVVYDTAHEKVGSLGVPELEPLAWLTFTSTHRSALEDVVKLGCTSAFVLD